MRSQEELNLLTDQKNKRSKNIFLINKNPVDLSNLKKEKL